MVQGLEPNTKYEFAVRLHVDQLSSPWSPVVYHTTLPEGKEVAAAWRSLTGNPFLPTGELLRLHQERPLELQRLH